MPHWVGCGERVRWWGGGYKRERLVCLWSTRAVCVAVVVCLTRLEQVVEPWKKTLPEALREELRKQAVGDGEEEGTEEDDCAERKRKDRPTEDDGDTRKKQKTPLKTPRPKVPPPSPASPPSKKDNMHAGTYLPP